MYLDHYGLAEAPFSITPDPRFVFLGDRHGDALAHLHYGITQGGGGGFVQLTGEVGTGKTTLCRLLLEQLPANVRVALVLNPRLSPIELLETIGEELRLDLEGIRGSVKGLTDRLNQYLLDAYAQGLRVVVIIDEAQNLSAEALEQVRLLTNLETPTQKLLQMILLGQPELRERLAQPELRQLSQRITARFHLTPLSADEVEAYVRHRLDVAGASRLPFTKLALQRLARESGGIPRLVNVLADRALLAGYARHQSVIDEHLMAEATTEVLGRPRHHRWRPRASLVAGLLLALATGLFFLREPHPPATPRATSPTEELSLGVPVIPRLDARGFAAVLATAADATPAWRELLGLWAVRANESDPNAAQGCPTVLAPGLFCLRTAGRLDSLALLGRPALVELRHAGQRRWALLLGVDAVQVRLWLSGQTLQINRTVFESHYAGRYAAIWRGPAFLAQAPQPGDTGPAADWLAARLAARDPAMASAGPTELGPAHVAAIRALQAEAGLRVDGIIGPETLLALGANAPGGPTLRRVLE